MTGDAAIQKQTADAAYTVASAAGACEDLELLKALGLHVDAIEAAEMIDNAIYRSMTAEEKAALHWESSQDLHKNRKPVLWDKVDDQVGHRMSHGSEADFLQRQTLMELIQMQLEKRRAAELLSL